MEELKMERTKYIDRDELKSLWRILERLQADVGPGGAYVWNKGEVDALITVMDAVKESYSSLPTLPENDSAKEKL